MSSINLDAVRIDSTTGMASCIDWVKFLMNATNAEASVTYRRIMEGAGESLKPLIGRMRINNCGVSTPVCAASTLIHLGLLVPNSHANAMELQGLSSLVLARALGGDKTLARQITQRQKSLTSLETKFFTADHPLLLTAKEKEEGGEDDTDEGESESEDGEEEDESYASEDEEDGDDEESSDSSATEVIAAVKEKNRKRKANKKDVPPKKKGRAARPVTPSRRGTEWGF
jgi:hypothetical protein